MGATVGALAHGDAHKLAEVGERERRGLLGIIYLAIRVGARGFGTYRHVLGLALTQNLFTQILIVAAILWANLSGQDNIVSAPEYSGGQGASWIHTILHLTVGWLVFSLPLWGIGSLALWATRKRGPAAAATA